MLRIAILGAGNIGTSIAEGLVQSGRFSAPGITLTRRTVQRVEAMKQKGFVVHADNTRAVKESEIVIVAVEPQQVDAVLGEIAPSVTDRHVLISVVTGVSIAQIEGKVGKRAAVVRAMPNTAIAVRESMTCLASRDPASAAVATATSVFDAVGKTVLINEEEMIAATALGACGVAFFLRAIRAASQGGIEVGLHSHSALAMAAQTAKGAATLLLAMGTHPEQEIDRVTTPKGCTIAGLNQMEHAGFSSAMIRGITVSADKASRLYADDDA
ncbi:MAG TPA: pyrroline-5-carboxylate reductase [Candidatus Krumholzibacteria bacterium]|nr:pyrroline-5-carboxylate reductase [Candidatus Krumholzibacteria bacterium]